MKVARLVCLCGVSLIGSGVDARVISYSPVSTQLAAPAVQSRAGRHFLLVELDGPTSQLRGRLVLYDSTGQTDRRVVLPEDGSSAIFTVSALFEGDGQPPRILVGTDASLSGDNPSHRLRYLVSADAGVSWRPLRLPDGASADVHPSLSVPSASALDRGGPFVSARRSGLRLGSSELPFLVAFRDSSLAGRDGVYGVKADGNAVMVFSHDPYSFLPCAIVGTDREGRRLLVAGVPRVTTFEERGLYIVSTSGAPIRQIAFPWGDPLSIDLEGWITPSGGAYLDFGLGTRSLADGTTLNDRRVEYVDGGATTEVLRLPPYRGGALALFAVPTSDYAGAWLARVHPDNPTTLFRHAPGRPAEVQWTDAAKPRLQAIHTGSSDARLLVEVNRPRVTTDGHSLVDPALAFWQPGHPAPASYDELYLDELEGRAFVHVDVDAAAEGADFYYNSGSGISVPTGGGPSGGGGGGGDVLQEWGVVRASLKQRLVFPWVARNVEAGKGGKTTQTDLILRNPMPDPIFVGFDFAPEGGSRGGGASLPGVTLQPLEVRLVEDVVKNVLKLDNASGSLFLDLPGTASIEATSHTYTATGAGSYGIGVPALDLATAADPGFPLTFSGALPGRAFRTDLLLTDATDRGSLATLHLASQVPEASPSDIALRTPRSGPVRVDGLAATFAAGPGSVVLQPTSGAVIPLLTVTDTRTGSPTYFPPDISMRRTRIIPAVVHSDGAGGARYRSDLYLYNAASVAQSVTLTAKLWDKASYASVPFTLLPLESETLPDVLFSVFGMQGVAWLSISTGYGSASGIRVASRTYTVLADGGTYGAAIPPLNSFQAARAGDSLAILGAVASPRYRTNLALVETSSYYSQSTTTSVDIEISDSKGAILETFRATLPYGGGLQLSDLFRTHAIGDRGPVLIRVTPVPNSTPGYSYSPAVIGAFATLVDQGTNAPIYLAPILLPFD